MTNFVKGDLAPPARSTLSDGITDAFVGSPRPRPPGAPSLSADAQDWAGRALDAGPFGTAEVFFFWVCLAPPRVRRSRCLPIGFVLPCAARGTLPIADSRVGRPELWTPGPSGPQSSFFQTINRVSWSGGMSGGRRCWTKSNSRAVGPHHGEVSGLEFAVDLAFDARLQVVSVREPVANPLREVVFRVFEDGGGFSPFDHLEGGL